MCEWLAFLMLLFGCQTCDVNSQAYMTFSPGMGDTWHVALNNDCPVRGIQFTITPPAVIEVETTRRTDGFFAQFNKVSGQVILLSLSGDKIAPGVGPILEIVFDCSYAAVVISNVKIVQ